MRLDTANRSFAALIGVALVPYLLAGVTACLLLSAIVVRIATGGVGALSTDEGNLWPAVAFFALVGTGAVLAGRSVVRQVQATGRLADHVHGGRVAASADVEAAAVRCGLAGRLDVLESDQSFSFAYGLLSPRVVLSRGLVEQLAPEELEAVLQHEGYHVRAYDPLKVVLARAVAPALFFLPVLRYLHERYVAGRELAADHRALRSAGRAPLAGALFKVVRGPGWSELGAAAAIGGLDLLDVRVAQLEGGSEPDLPRPGSTVVALSALGGALLVGTLLWSVVSFGGPSELMRVTMGDSMGAMASSGMDGSVDRSVLLGVWGLALVGIVLLARRLRRRSGRQAS